jgi:mRNA interferase MazF
VIVTRDVAVPFLANVTVAAITSSIRGLPTEVLVGPEHGLAHESAVNCDNLFTVPKSLLGRRRGALDSEASVRLGRALRIALELD